MKKLFSAITAVCIMTFAFISINADAANVKYMSVFGDSIPAGYGLASQSNNFVNLLAEEYGLEMDKNSYNFSISGTTSSQILEQIKSTDYEILKNSDTIIISAGGNDILNTYGKNLLESAEHYQSELENAGINLNYNNPINMLSQVSSMFFDTNKAEIIPKIFDEAINQEAKTQYSNTVSNFSKNINEMVSYIRSIGSQADIYFLTLYNPISVFAIDNDFFNNLDESIEIMQNDILALADSSNKIHAVDVLDDFNGHYADWTYIYQFDIHPNKNGHNRIYSLISNAVKAVFDTEENITETSSESSAVSEENSDISIPDSSVTIQSEISSVSQTDSSYYESIEHSSYNNYTIWIITGGIILIFIIAAVIIIIVKNSK